MRFLRHFLALAVLCVCVTGAARAQLTDDVVVENETTITIRGYLSTGIAEKFKSLLNDKIEVVKIFSGGGHPLAAMDIGRTIRARKLSLYIPGACTAACAQYVFMAAEKRFIDPQALVGFSSSPSAMELMAANNEADEVRIFFARMADTEKQFYAEIGAPEEMLYIPQVLLNPACYAVVRGANGRLQDVTLNARFQIFIPKKSYLEGSGIALTGFWPADSESFRAMMVKQVRSEGLRLFSWGGPDGPLSADLKAQFRASLSAVKECAAKLPESAPIAP